MLPTVIGLACATVLLAACASDGQGIEPSIPQSSNSSPVATWYAAVSPLIGQLEQSITHAQSVVRDPRHVGLAGACRTIRTEAAQVRTAPTAPDATIRRAVAREIDAFDTAATECLAGRYGPAGRAVNVGHHWAEVGGRRLVVLLHLPARTGTLL